jgi:dephospho-CoA kinase
MNYLVGISGKARSGKDTFAQMLARRLQAETGYSFVLMAYAHELKSRIQEDFDMSYEQLWGDEKEEYDKRYKKDRQNWIAGRRDHDEIKENFWTPREVMQAYGQFFRTIDYDFWVKYLFKVVEEQGFENVIVTDLRHINEVDAVVNRGGYHVRVERKEKDDVHNDQHISETALDEGYRIDFKVDNSGTLEDLDRAAEDVAKFIMDSKKLNLIV